MISVAAGATVPGTLPVRRRAAQVGAAGLTLVAVSAHVVHILGSALVPDELSYWPTVFGTAGIGLGAWTSGLVGAGLALAGKLYGLLFCALAGASGTRPVSPVTWPAPRLTGAPARCRDGLPGRRLLGHDLRTGTPVLRPGCGAPGTERFPAGAERSSATAGSV
jgi:hypothetical protein